MFAGLRDDGGMISLLDTFMAVYETRQFVAAAAELHISQSTVSERIASLERQVGHQLFTRPPRRDVVPTAAGERLYAAAQTMTSTWSAALGDIEREARAREPFRVFTSHTATHILLPRLLKACEPFLEKIELAVTPHNSEDIFAAAARKDIEFGIIEKPLSGESVMRRPLISDRLVHAGRPDQPWLVREEGSGVRYYTDLYFRRLTSRPSHVIEIAGNEAICGALEAGFGQSVVSGASISDAVPRTILDEEFTRKFYALMPRTGESELQRRVAAALIAALRG